MAGQISARSPRTSPRCTRTPGSEIHLGLEPEPSCFLETTAETDRIFPRRALDERRGRGAENPRLRCRSRPSEILRRHIGVCFDTCHVALQFEDPLAALRAYRSEGIRISKVQLSAALMTGGDKDLLGGAAAVRRGRLSPPGEGAHRRGRNPLVDRSPAGARRRGRIATASRRRACISTCRFFSKATARSPARCPRSRRIFFASCVAGARRRHVEIETYTFDVLPEDVRPADAVSSISREFTWVEELL